MPDLIAQGQEPSDRWRRKLPPREPVILGRAGRWAADWDPQISRRHVEIIWKHGRLRVTRLETATNPVFTRGKQYDEFVIKPGEQFVIGTTTFSLADERINVSLDDSQPMTEKTFTHQALRELKFRNADQRIDVLSRLPEIIDSATSDKELLVRVVNVLLSGVPRASTAAIVAARPNPAEGQSSVEVLQWDRRTLTGEDFRPSERLIMQAVETGESVMHIWAKSGPAAANFTLSEEADWALCVPTVGPACDGWALYVSGQFAASDFRPGSGPDDPFDLNDDLKFTKLAANTLGSLRQLRTLERTSNSLRQFLSPVVLEALADADPEEVLEPREATVSVLFCDLRGFSRKSEESADDLWDLLNRVSRALGVTTRHILDQQGVVGDFHGDAAMGFWGWPLPQEDAVSRACLTALAIRAEFEAASRRPEHPLSGFQIGIGIATGPAVAGKIGTVDQIKVTAFGPVVNLASRLEGMTKFLHAPILLDEATASSARQHLSDTVGRVRRLARIRPYGMESDFEVSELLPSAAEYSDLSDDALAQFEQAVAAMQAKDWDSAFELLHQVPAEDRVKDFLTVFMASHNRTPPTGWDGVIPLSGK